MTPGMKCIALVLRTDGLGLLGPCVFAGYGSPPPAIVDGSACTPAEAEPLVGGPQNVAYFRMATGECLWSAECFWVKATQWPALKQLALNKGIPIVPVTLSVLRSAIQLG